MKKALLDFIYLQNSVFPAASGEADFSMTDIPAINIPNLYISWNLPAGNNIPLLVFVHGWSGGGQVTGNLDPAAITFLHAQGIGILGVGLRGRNTGTAYANVNATVEEYRDAFGQEAYDEYASVKYFLDSIATTGHINEEKIIRYGISGAGFGTPVKIPDLYSLIVNWYTMAKYGTYEGDPGFFTGWYTDDANFQGSIQLATGGAPKGSAGYSAGALDTYYLSRDHIRAAKNILQKVYLYHDSGDATVFVDHSDLLEDEFIANSKTYVYNRSTNSDYAHGNADLIFGEYPGLGNSLDWVDDAKTLTRPTAPNTGTFHVPGFLVLDKSDLTIWIKKYYTNNPATPRAGSFGNQGKIHAASVVYNLTNDTYEVTPVFPGAVGDQFFFINITRGVKTVQALVAASDVVTLVPKTLAKSPLNLSSYTWKCFFDLSDTDSYILDDASKVSNLIDLTGNGKNFYQHIRATRVAVSSSSYLDNGLYQIKSSSGTLGDARQNNLVLSGEFTIVAKYDFDAATIGDVSNEGLFGRGGGSESYLRFSTFSGKLQIELMVGATYLSNATPSNTNVGVQTIVIRRNSSNAIEAKIKNTTNTYTYNLGTASSDFDLRYLGTATTSSKEFDGDIYKFAAVNQRLSDGDTTTILDNL